MEDTKTENNGTIPFDRQKKREQENKQKSSRSNINYPPYVGCHGSITELFKNIRQASVPPKFTQDYMSSVLGMKSSSHRAFIPLLKKLGFIDQSSIPTNDYYSYRDDESSRKIMAQKIKEAYSDLYRTHEYAHELSKKELISKLKTLTGAGESNPTISAVIGTFLALKELADFNVHEEISSTCDLIESEKREEKPLQQNSLPNINKNSLGLSYAIYLNLPATQDIRVYNAIFSSLKENIIDAI